MVKRNKKPNKANLELNAKFVKMVKKLSRSRIYTFLGLALVFGSWYYFSDSKLDKYYYNELRIWSGGLLSSDPQVRSASEKQLEKVESQMQQDGYNRAEIRDLSIRAYEKAVEIDKKIQKLYKEKG